MGKSINNKILIVEDDAIIRSCLVEDIQSAAGFSVIGAVDSIAQAKSFPPASYQILLLDLNLTDGHGLELLQFLNSYPLRPRVLILSVLGDEKTVLQVIEEGADAYLLKDATPAEIIASLESVLAGDSASSPPITKILVDSVKQHRRPQQAVSTNTIAALAVRLSPRELDVLKLLAHGNSYQQMADELGITYNTVSYYVKQLYGKLEVRSKNEAIYKAVSDGLIRI